MTKALQRERGIELAKFTATSSKRTCQRTAGHLGRGCGDLVAQRLVLGPKSGEFIYHSSLGDQHDERRRLTSIRCTWVSHEARTSRAAGRAMQHFSRSFCFLAPNPSLSRISRPLIA